MPKQETEETPEETPEQTPEPDQEAFWTRLKKETATVVDARLAERDKKRAESGDGKRRSSAKRTTVPGIIADIVFGPDKK